MILAHYYFLKRTKTKAILFSNMSALRKMAKGNIITANITHLVLRSVLLITIIIAASGTTLWVMGERADVNIIYALDSSASMTSPDIGTSRFETGKSIISSITNNAPLGINYALISFAGVTKIQQRFTQEKIDLLIALEDTAISRIGGTDIGGAIITAANLFESRSDEGKILVIISDGLDNAGSFISGSPQEAVQYAKENQVIIYAIAVGSDSGALGFLPEYYQIPSMFNDELLIFMTEETGGNYYKIESVAEIPRIIQSIELNTQRAYINYNLYYYAFLIIFILIILEWILANTLYRRVL